VSTIPDIRLSVGTRQVCDSCGHEANTVTLLCIGNDVFRYLCWDCERTLWERLSKNVAFHDRCRTLHPDDV
jgi:transposase-like protein